MRRKEWERNDHQKGNGAGARTNPSAAGGQRWRRSSITWRRRAYDQRACDDHIGAAGASVLAVAEQLQELVTVLDAVDDQDRINPMEMAMNTDHRSTATGGRLWQHKNAGHQRRRHSAAESGRHGGLRAVARRSHDLAAIIASQTQQTPDQRQAEADRAQMAPTPNGWRRRAGATANTAGNGDAIQKPAPTRRFRSQNRWRDAKMDADNVDPTSSSKRHSSPGSANRPGRRSSWRCACTAAGRDPHQRQRQWRSTDRGG